MAMRVLVSGLALCAALSACSSDLEVKGETQRVVGESVIFELVEGEPTFANNVTLVDARGATYGSTELGLAAGGERKLRFVVPTGIAAGSAVARVQKKGSSGDEAYYRVPLTISRLAAALDATGRVELIPLPPSELKRNRTDKGDGADGALSLSPSGALLVAAVAKKVRLYDMGRVLEERTSVDLPGEGTALVALPDGALVATASTVERLQLAGTKAKRTTLQLEGVQALDTSTDGSRAVALVRCDTDSDAQADSDCVVPLSAKAAPPKAQTAVTLDSKPSAEHIALRSDGLAAVIPDQETIYGVDLSVTPPKISQLPWRSCWPSGAGTPPTSLTVEPVGVTRSSAEIEGQKNDLFAIADKRNNLVCTFGFKSGSLRPVAATKLDEPPTAIAYGRTTDLYVVAGDKLLELDAGRADLPAKDLKLETAAAVTSFAVQR